MLMTQEDIFGKVAEVLEEALGCDDDEITPTASLTADLGAESIDFLDIVFRLEKAFGTPEAPFKIETGELFPENFMDNADWVQDGKFTDAGMAMLCERMPHVDFKSFESDREVVKVGDLITVQSLADFVTRKLEGSGG
jgi:acyl carrier protein